MALLNWVRLNFFSHRYGRAGEARVFFIEVGRPVSTYCMFPKLYVSQRKRHHESWVLESSQKTRFPIKGGISAVLQYLRGEYKGTEVRWL